MLLIALLFSSAALPQTSVTLTAQDSKCIASGNSANWNDNRYRAYWYDPGQGFVDGFAKFNLSSIPTGATITGMTLRAFHEAGFGNPYNNPEVRVYRSANDAWSRSQNDLYPGVNESLTGLTTTFPANDLVPVDFLLNVNAVNWSTDLADDKLTLVLRNEAGSASRYSYVYFYGSDAAPAPPQLIVEYTSGPTLQIFNLVGGSPATFQVTNATGGGQVGVALSRQGGGPTNLLAGPCGVMSMKLTPPLIVVGIGAASGAGTKSFSLNVPVGASGAAIWSQGLDFSSCTATNGVNQIIG